MLSDIGQMVEHCNDFAEMFPYLVVAPGEPAGCWDFGENAEIVSASGCVDWAAFGSGHADQVELELEVTSAFWSGTVRFDNTP